MKTYRRIHFITFAVILILPFLLLACGKTENQADAKDIVAPEKVVPVSIETVALSDLTETFTLPANLEAWEDLVISAELAGPVRKIHYQEGQRVKAGSVLLEIDPDTVRSNLARDKENYAVTKRKLERYRQLREEGLTSVQDVDELENSLKSAESALRTTRFQLDKAFPKAPVDGFVDQHFIDRGEYVDPGKALVRLVQVDRLKAIADLPEKDVPYIQVGQQVEIIPAIINNRAARSLFGTIEHIAYSADSSTRTYRTKIAIDNSDGQLRPGMIVRARFVRQKLEQVVAVPLYAVMDRDGEKRVFIEENGVARRLVVKTSSSVNQKVVVTEGLEPGQRLIVKGQQLLIDGAKVKIGEY